MALWIFSIVLVFVAVVVIVALAVVPFATAPICWLPAVSESEALLGTLLAAQAAITALSLAVSLFVMQGASTRRDSDDRFYLEYLRRAGIRPVIWGSVFAVGATAAVLLIEKFVTAAPAAVASTPGLRNLTLVAISMFFANLLLVIFLFERMLRLVRPESWYDIRRHVNRRDVRKAVKAFLRRYARAKASQGTGDIDASVLFPDTGEGSANEAIRLLLDDARRAIDERRQSEFVRSLDSIKELVEYALNELEKSSYKWGEPGSSPHWPPLWELNSNLYSFRKEVIRRANIDDANAILSFDYWLLSKSIDRNCGELFAESLTGYRHSYEIAQRTGDGELLEAFRNRFWQNAPYIFRERISDEAYTYMNQMVHLQERLLHDALLAGHQTEFTQLHQGFEDFLLNMRRLWMLDSSRLQEAERLLRRLEQDYRIALMRLGGRTVLLTASGSLPDPSSYLDIVRRKHVSVGVLAGDIARALELDDTRELTQWIWRDLDIKPTGRFLTGPVSLEELPLTWFTVRLLEMSVDSLQNLDLHGRAQQTLNWFEANVGRLEAYAGDSTDPSIQQSRQYATVALNEAVQLDDVNRDQAIIQSDLCSDKISAFGTSVSAAAFSTNPIVRLFAQADAVIPQPSDSGVSQDEHIVPGFEPKEAFIDLRENANIDDSQRIWSKRISNDVIRLFCEAQREARQIIASLQSSSELLQAIDEAIEELGPSGQLVVVLDGDWDDVIYESDLEGMDRYEPQWRIREEEDYVGEFARYRGHTIVISGRSGARNLYVVDFVAWGRCVQAPTETEMAALVEIDEITPERAMELLEENPNHIPSESEKQSKLRKLQTCVEVTARHFTEFQVDDPSRARHVTST